MNWEMFMYFEYRISMLFLWGFVISFLTLRYSKLVTVLGAVCGILASGLLEAMQMFGPNNPALFVAITVLEVLVTQGLVWVLSEQRDWRAIFTGMSASSYVLMGNAACMLVWSLKENWILALAAETLIHGALLTFLNMQIRSVYLDLMKIKSRNWSKLCIIPVLFYVTLYSLCIWPVNLRETPQAGLTVVFVLAVMVSSYIVMFKLFFRRRKEHELEQNYLFIETYASGLRHETEALRKAEEKLLIRQHDIRHTLGMIRSYLEQGDTERIFELLNYTEKNMESELPSRFCENITINGILSEYAARAGEMQDIDFKCKAEIPPQFERANEFEVATVVANLLENAVNAAGSEENVYSRWVKVRIHPHKEQLLVEISNGYAGELKISAETGFPDSGKGEGHGYGLRSVAAYAEKMGGIFEYKAEDRTFLTRLLIDF